MKHAFIWGKEKDCITESHDVWERSAAALIKEAACDNKVKIYFRAFHDLIDLAYISQVDEAVSTEAIDNLQTHAWVFKKGGKKYRLEQDKEGTIWAIRKGHYLNEPDPDRLWMYQHLPFRCIDEQGREWYSKAAPIRFTKYNMWTRHEERPQMMQSPLQFNTEWAAVNWVNSLQHIPVGQELK